MINGLGNAPGLTGGFAFLHRVERSEEDLAALSPQVDSALSTAQPASTSNLMSRNFFNSNHEQSKYVSSSLEAKQQEAVQAQRMTSVVTSLIAQAAVWNMQRAFGGEDKIDNTYVIGSRLGAASSKAVGQVGREYAMEESRQNLDELKDDLKKRAAPKDENGEPTQGLLGDQDGETAPPVTSASGPAVKAQAPTAPAATESAVQSAAPMAAPAASQDASPDASPAAAPLAPAAPSINITV